MSFYSLPSSSSIWLSVRGNAPYCEGSFQILEDPLSNHLLRRGLSGPSIPLPPRKKPCAVIIDKIVEKRKSDPVVPGLVGAPGGI